MAAAVEHGVSHFIFSSTAAVYGAPKTSPIAGTDAKQPVNPYGWSKLMTEQMLIDVNSAHNVNYCILRYFNVAGADPRGRSGQATIAATHLIKVAVQAATDQRDHVDVFGTDYETEDGTGVRDYIHVSDLASARVCALEALIEQPHRSLTLNCGYGSGFSVLQVLDAVDRVAGRKITRRFLPRRPGDPDSLVSDPRQIRLSLGWTPQFADLDTIIEHALKWEQLLIDRGSI